MTDTPSLPASELIDDLYDLVRNFGRPVPEGLYLFVTAARPKPIFVAVSARIDALQMQALANHENADFDEEMVFVISKNGIMLRWNTALTVDDIAGFIGNVDTMMRSLDGFDKKGRRHRVPYALSKRIFHRSVMATFTERTMLMSVGTERAATAHLRQFDHPELLEPIQDHFGNWHLGLRVANEENLRRMVAKRRACERLGLMNVHDIAALDENGWRRFHVSFEEELQRKPN